MNYRKHFITINTTIKHCLRLLGEVGLDTILFVVNKNDQLIGCVTDGDIRRGLLNDVTIKDSISKVLNSNPKFIRKESYNINDLKNLRNKNYKLIPVLDKNDIIIKVINFRSILSYLPIDIVIMAGGLGSRLKPLTDNTPKSLLKIGNKTIIDYNLDRLISFGVDNFWISVRHLADQIKDHFKNRNNNINIEFVDEDTPLGTIGAVSKINNFKHDYILITNSDILTNLNYEDFFQDFIEKNADMSVATIPYDVKIPYAVMETKNNEVFSFLEKPTFTYYSNGGIYLIKKSILKNIPKNKFYNATDLMNFLLEKKLKLISYPNKSYWLDIGKHEDYAKAQIDIKSLDFNNLGEEKNI